MSDNAVTLDEVSQDLEEWRASRKRASQRCPHCGHRPSGAPTESDVIALIGYVLDGQKGAAHIRGVTLQTVKNQMTHLYRNLDVASGMQAAYLLGRGDLTGGIQ